MKKRVLPILTALTPYLMATAFLCLIRFTPELLQLVSPLLVYFLILSLGPILGFVCMVSGLLSADLPTGLLAKWSLSVKSAHIPFYVVNFLLAFLAMPLFAPYFFLMDAAVLFLSSSLGIAAILRARRERVISTKETVLHVILHCFFVSDMISTFLIYGKLKNS